MSARLIRKYRSLFPHVPFALLVILATLIISSVILNFVFPDSEGFFVNLLSELLGLLITIYIVSGLFFQSDKKQWKEVEEIISVKCRAFINFFYLNLAYHFNINVLNASVPLENLQGQDTGWDKMRTQITEQVKTGFYSLTGDELKKVSRWLSEALEEISGLISYMEKRPGFLQIKELYQVEFLLEDIHQNIKVYDLIYKLEDDEVVYNKKELNKIAEGFDDLLCLLVKIEDNSKRKKASA